MRYGGDGRRRLRWALVGAALLAWLVLAVDDWGRDFTSDYAEVSAEAAETDLRPLASERSVRELATAVRWAARRIGGWEHTGDSFEDDAATVLLVGRSPVLRLADDIVVRIVDRGGQRIVTASSGSRRSLWIGDLGRNPRNLRRLFAELRDVLDGSTRRPAPEAS